MAAAGCQHDLGSLVRSLYAAAAALEYAQAPQSGMITRHNSIQKVTDELTTRYSSLSVYPEDSKISSGYDDEEIASERGEGWEDAMEDSGVPSGNFPRLLMLQQDIVSRFKSLKGKPGGFTVVNVVMLHECSGWPILL
ncbi:TPA: hypothetical protein ACH3X1_013577 [Trebouxia sp. C0004]